MVEIYCAVFVRETEESEDIVYVLTLSLVSGWSGGWSPAPHECA